MTFLQVVNIIRDTALAQPNVNTVVREFLDLNREDTKYSAVVIQDRDGLRDRIVEQDWNTYTFHLGYVDRLTFDESNRDDIFSTGINVINNIVASIRDRWDLEVSIIDRFSTFNQRFTASCAGVYVVLAIQVPVSDCVDGEETDLYDKFEAKITENGHYHFVPDGRPVDEIYIDVNVEGQKPEDRLVETISSNGSYHYFPEEGRVFSEADIEVDVHPSNKLVETITSNGSYSYPDEYAGADITVAVSAAKPEESLVETITSNGSYSYSPTPGSVFSSADITVSVPVPRISSLITMSVTENGVQRWGASEGEAWNFVEIPVDVHPSTRLVETITSNGVTSFSGEWNGADITVAVSAAKPEESLVETISSNGSYHYDPSAGSVFSGADITVDVHPSTSLSKTYTTNGTKTITGEFNGGTVTISVHPSMSLSRTYTSNGTYNISGEFNGGTINVQVPDGSLPEPEDDEIYYITYSGRPLQDIYFTDFDVNVVSNTYDETRNICILKFDGTLTRIGDTAFEYKPQLKKMRLPDTVTEVGVRSFWQSGLIEIRMDGVTSIQEAAFGDCYALLSNMCIPDGCLNIGKLAYQNCTGAHTAVIPSSVISIGAGAFVDDYPLQVVYVNATVPPTMISDPQDGYNQFSNTSGNLTILVPANSLQDYLAAPGWSDYASRIVAQ